MDDAPKLLKIPKSDVKGTCQLNENSGDTPKSECMRVKRTSGIWPASNQESAMFYREQLRQRNLEHACGEGRRSQLRSKESRCWERLWGHRDFVRKHLEIILKQHEVLLNGIPRGPPTCSRRGCCSCTVRQLEQTTSCE